MSSLGLNYREQSLFETYQSEAYSDLFKALTLAEDNISLRIIKTKGDWTKKKLRKIKTYIDEEITKSYGGIFEKTQKEIIATSQVVAGAYLTGYKLPKGTISDLINSQREIQGYGFKQLFKLGEDNHARQLKVLVAAGVSEARTPLQIARDIQLKNTKLSKGQIKSDIYTIISESRAEARHKTYQQQEKSGLITGYIYDATLDGRTSIYCREHDQRIYRESIEEIQHLINTHFNCRSVFNQLTTTTEKTLRASSFGEVPAQSYETWFKTTTKEFQRSTLANRQYSAFLKGNYKVKGLGDLTGKTNLSDVKKLI